MSHVTRNPLTNMATAIPAALTLLLRHVVDGSALCGTHYSCVLECAKHVFCKTCKQTHCFISPSKEHDHVTWCVAGCRWWVSARRSRRREPAPTAVGRPLRPARVAQLAWQCPAYPRPLHQRSIRPSLKTGATLRYERCWCLHTFPFIFLFRVSFSALSFHIDTSSSLGELSYSHGDEHEDGWLSSGIQRRECGRYSPQITSWSPKVMRVLRQCKVQRAEVMFVTIQRENIRHSNKWTRLLQSLNCPMFAFWLWIITSPYRWPVGSLPSTCMLCTSPVYVYTPQ
jgi:hypothetical protein